MTHLSALNTRLSNERLRLSQATNTNEIELRTVWVSQIEKEIAGEQSFLAKDTRTNAELLSELFS